MPKWRDDHCLHGQMEWLQNNLFCGWLWSILSHMTPLFHTLDMEYYSIPERLPSPRTDARRASATGFFLERARFFMPIVRTSPRFVVPNRWRKDNRLLLEPRCKKNNFVIQLPC